MYNNQMFSFESMGKETEFARNFLLEASALARKIQEEMVNPALEKSDRSPVTVADIAVQALLGYHLNERVPGAALIAEESSSMLTGEGGRRLASAASGFLSELIPGFREESFRALLDYGTGRVKPNYWVLDPIDGTKGFLRGDQYAIALAYIHEGEVHLGALACPRLTPAGPAEEETAETGTIYMAVKGEGSGWMREGAPEWSQIRISENSDPVNAVILRSFESGHTDVSGIDEVASQLGITADHLKVDSQVKYALLALGRGDIYLRIPCPETPGYVEKIWDHAAGKLLVEEAGGLVTDIFGKPLDFSRGRFLDQNRGVVATNGHLHSLVLEALQPHS